MKSFFFLLALLFSLSLGATVLTAEEVKKLIGDFPKSGSILEREDFLQMLDLQKTRTKKECAQAAKEVRIKLKEMFAGKNRPLSLDEMNQIYPKISKVYSSAASTSGFAKSLYNRPRPYLTHPAIKPCISLESSTAYPSGHTTIARAVARALAQEFPERSEKLIQRADEVAFNRVLGGVHHPSDIAAGKKLGDAVAKKLGVYLE